MPDCSATKSRFVSSDSSALPVHKPDRSVFVRFVIQLTASVWDLDGQEPAGRSELAPAAVTLHFYFVVIFHLCLRDGRRYSQSGWRTDTCWDTSPEPCTAFPLRLPRFCVIYSSCPSRCHAHTSLIYNWVKQQIRIFLITKSQISSSPHLRDLFSATVLVLLFRSAAVFLVKSCIFFIFCIQVYKK